LKKSQKIFLFIIFRFRKKTEKKNWKKKAQKKSFGPVEHQKKLSDWI